MAKYTGTVLTNKGKKLLARAILGEVIVFTKVEIGEGILSPGTDKETLTSLVDSFKILSITSSSKLPNGGYRIRISFNNKGFIDDTYLREVGVYARGEDGVEILYSYCNTDTPNLIPNESSGIIESVEDIITYISSAATINAVIDQSNVYATIKDLVEGLATKEDKFNKNDAFNKSFGTITGTVMEGDKRATDLGGEGAFNKNSGFNKNKSDAVNSNDSNTLATSKAAKTAYDRGTSGVTKADAAQNSANSAQTKANQAYTLANEKEPKFSKKTGWNLDISHLINSSSKTLVASALAVKIAYDKALEALGLANTNKNAIQNNTEQIENLTKVVKVSGSDFQKLISIPYPTGFTRNNCKVSFQDMGSVVHFIQGYKVTTDGRNYIVNRLLGTSSDYIAEITFTKQF
ncbi:tail fiber protein [Psychrilyobacter atlanticus]|uniref:tail fiber protein n=1 Tax=Psychrilyobacter atlanticus TaxID=271091 RepID=UPI0003FD3C0D|nr:tail fiber protein [Psychrilyobacter atlanticus]